MPLFDPDPERPPLVVLGKPNPRKDEFAALTFIGQAMAHLGRRWETPNATGVATIIREAYLAECVAAGIEPVVTIMPSGSPLPEHPWVMIFTDKKFQQSLDERYPAWRDYRWHIIHNPMETKQTAREMEHWMRSRGISVQTKDGGDGSGGRATEPKASAGEQVG